MKVNGIFQAGVSWIIPKIKKKKSSLQLLATNINKNYPNTFMGILKSLYSAKPLERSIKLGEDFNIKKPTNLFFTYNQC